MRYQGLSCQVCSYEYVSVIKPFKIILASSFCCGRFLGGSKTKLVSQMVSVTQMGETKMGHTLSKYCGIGLGPGLGKITWQSAFARKSKHLKACLGTALVTVLDRRGPPWLSVSHGFGSGSPLGTPLVTVLDRRGPPWHSVSHSFGSEGASLALC